MLKSSRKGFTLIEIIVVIVILAVLMAIAVPSVMKYVSEGNATRYYAVSRSAYQKVTVEISKFEGGMSDYKNPRMACSRAIVKLNESVPEDLKIYRVKIFYDLGTNPIQFTSDNTLNGPGSLDPKQSVDHISYIYFAFGTSSSTIHAYTYVYPNKKVEYHSN